MVLNALISVADPDHFYSDLYPSFYFAMDVAPYGY
jgi:hypothetical protein